MRNNKSGKKSGESGGGGGVGTSLLPNRFLFRTMFLVVGDFNEKVESSVGPNRRMKMLDGYRLWDTLAFALALVVALVVVVVVVVVAVVAVVAVVVVIGCWFLFSLSDGRRDQICDEFIDAFRHNRKRIHTNTMILTSTKNLL
jgi:fatty acid desaturase